MNESFHQCPPHDDDDDEGSSRWSESQQMLGWVCEMRVDVGLTLSDILSLDD